MLGPLFLDPRPFFLDPRFFFFDPWGWWTFFFWPSPSFYTPLFFELRSFFLTPTSLYFDPEHFFFWPHPLFFDPPAFFWPHAQSNFSHGCVCVCLCIWWKMWQSQEMSCRLPIHWLNSVVNLKNSRKNLWKPHEKPEIMNDMARKPKGKRQWKLRKHKVMKHRRKQFQTEWKTSEKAKEHEQRIPKRTRETKEVLGEARRLKEHRRSQKWQGREGRQNFNLYMTEKQKTIERPSKETRRRRNAMVPPKPRNSGWS